MNLPGLETSRKNPTSISGEKLIFLIGLLGIILSPLLIVISVSLEGCQIVQDAISTYYYTISRNVFVGTLCALALCLMVYRGYSAFDEWLANAAAFFALGVAFFPTSVTAVDCIEQSVPGSIISTVHFISAALLFITFAVFSLFLFTKSDKEKLSTRKKRENLIYRSCGIIIVICLVAIFVYMKFVEPLFSELSPVFWLESIALWAFSISWLVKSKIIIPEAAESES